jgi:hypothetical protein
MPSSVKVNVPGSVMVKIAGISGLSGLQDLGYTTDGVEVEEREFSMEVKSDRYGGEQGPAIDKQMFGREALIRLTLVEFNAEYFHWLESRMPGNATIVAAPGQIITPGTLGFAAGNLVRCLLYGVLDLAAVTGGTPATELLTPRNYPFCSVVEASSRNLGSRHARANLTLKAYQGLVSGNVVLWNRTAT